MNAIYRASSVLFIGMPYPQNFETAKEVEAIVRQNGATPATIAILDGVPCIGVCPLLCIAFASSLFFYSIFK